MVDNQMAVTAPVFDHKTKGRSRLTNHAARQVLPDLGNAQKLGLHNLTSG
jgi:hypothetical protein